MSKRRVEKKKMRKTRVEKKKMRRKKQAIAESEFKKKRNVTGRYIPLTRKEREEEEERRMKSESIFAAAYWARVWKSDVSLSETEPYTDSFPDDDSIASKHLNVVLFRGSMARAWKNNLFCLDQCDLTSVRHPMIVPL